MVSHLVWLVVLNCLTDDAASWAGLHIITTAVATAWANENVFKAHFCVSDNKEVAIAELTKLCKTLHKLGSVKEYTAQFNVVAARTSFSNNKRKHYWQGLPYRIKDKFATTAHDISNLTKTQKVALLMDQQLAQCAEEKPCTFSFRKHREKVAATTDDRPFTGTCWNCSKCGHKSEDCCRNCAKLQQAAASTSLASSELVVLQAQLKAVKECGCCTYPCTGEEGFLIQAALTAVRAHSCTNSCYVVLGSSFVYEVHHHPYSHSAKQQAATQGPCGYGGQWSHHQVSIPVLCQTEPCVDEEAEATHSPVQY